MARSFVVKRILAVAGLGLVLAACSGEGGREFARYYDPLGFFTTNLPAANSISVTPPQSGQDGPGFLTGVIATPPQPSASPQAGIGGAFNVAQTEPPDQTIYEAFAVTTTDFESLLDMGLFFLTGDPAVDLQMDESVMMDGLEGRLLVADVENDGQVTASVAVVLTLGEGGTGYLLVAIFPPGEWDEERPDFLRVLDSFRVDVPPGLRTHPVTAGAA